MTSGSRRTATFQRVLKNCGREFNQAKTNQAGVLGKQSSKNSISGDVDLGPALAEPRVGTHTGSAAEVPANCRCDVPGVAMLVCGAYFAMLPAREREQIFAAPKDWAEIATPRAKESSFV